MQPILTTEEGKGTHTKKLQTHKPAEWCRKIDSETLKQKTSLVS